MKEKYILFYRFIVLCKMAEENVTGNIKVQSTNEFNNVSTNLCQYIFISLFKLCNKFCYFFILK